MRFCHTGLFCLLIAGFVSSPASAKDEWPQFRGPDGNGHTAARNLPIHFGEGKAVIWKQAIPGEGHSSPVISGKYIWLTTAETKKLTPEEEKARLANVKNPRGLALAGKLKLKVICVSRASGKIVTQLTAFYVDEPEPKHSLNSYASPTPVIDNGRLFVHFGTYGTACIDTTERSFVWKSNELKIDHQNGPGSSPVVWNNLLIVHYDGIDAQFLAAYDKETGDIVWTTKRSGEMNPKPEFQKAYGTPALITVNGKDQLISPAADWVYGYNPATGKEIWKANYGKLGFSTVPKPVFGHGMAFICTSFIQSRLVAVKYDGTGDVSATHVAWTSDSQIPQKPSIALVDDKLFFVNDAGIATCLDAKTGESIWRTRIGGKYSASPLVANGKIYFFNQEGKCTVIKAGDTFEVLAENQFDAGFMASPAVAGDSLFLRTETHLYCIEKEQ